MIWIIIFGMAIVTAIPRILPAYIVDKARFPDWINKWLQAIPYAALGALIYPGILSVVPEKPHIGFIAGVVAILLSWLGVHVILVVVSSIITVLLWTI